MLVRVDDEARVEQLRQVRLAAQRTQTNIKKRQGILFLPLYLSFLSFFLDPSLSLFFLSFSLNGSENFIMSVRSVVLQQRAEGTEKWFFARFFR